MSELDKQKETVHNAINTLFDIAKVQKAEIDLLNVNIANKQAEIDELKAKLEKAQAVPEGVNHKGGYYIQDLRNPIGNCMKFWYRSGYGTKHAKLFWCETLEEAKEYQGGCDWFKIWYAPYIDSLVEYTVDMQLADRQREKLMIEAAQGEGHE